MARTFSRKTFLRGAAGATGAVAAGVLLGPVRAQGLPGESDWKALGTAIDGRVILPSDDQYAAAKSVFNTGFGGSTPAAVITVKSTSDVQKAVAFAASNNVQVAPRSGGHSYIGASAANGAIMIDLRPLSGEVAYDDGSGLVTVPTAADLQSVQTALAAHGRSIPTGSCPSVGAAGLTLGGLGIDSRAHGLTCDMLASASVVLPSGDEVTASAGEHDDLYWALRGGGGGNFGVTTSLMFRTFPVADQDLVKLQFPFPATAQVIVGWHNWLTKADASMWSMVDITSGPDGQGAASC